MSITTTDRRPSALASLKRHWIPAALIVLLTTLLGIGLAMTRPTTYTGETRLAVGKGEMSALNIPGYPTAAKEMASNYARWVTDQGVSGIKPPEGVSTLQASPIPESSIIRIEAKANDAETAVKASQQAADALMNEVNKARQADDPALIMKDIVANSPALSRAQAGAAGTLAKYNRDLGNNASSSVIAADLEAFAQTDTVRAQLEAEQNARLDKYRRIVSTESTEADLQTVGQGAQLTGNDRNSTIQRGALLGFGVGALLALLTTVWLDRRKRPERVATAPATAHVATPVERDGATPVVTDGATAPAAQAQAQARHAAPTTTDDTRRA